jgi:hypothetical protein
MGMPRCPWLRQRAPQRVKKQKGAHEPLLRTGTEVRRQYAAQHAQQATDDGERKHGRIGRQPGMRGQKAGGIGGACLRIHVQVIAVQADAVAHGHPRRVRVVIRTGHAGRWRSASNANAAISTGHAPLKARDGGYAQHVSLDAGARLLELVA